MYLRRQRRQGAQAPRLPHANLSEGGHTAGSSCGPAGMPGGQVQQPLQHSYPTYPAPTPSFPLHSAWRVRLAPFCPFPPTPTRHHTATPATHSHSQTPQRSTARRTCKKMGWLTTAPWGFRGSCRSNCTCRASSAAGFRELGFRDSPGISAGSMRHGGSAGRWPRALNKGGVGAVRAGLGHTSHALQQQAVGRPGRAGDRPAGCRAHQPAPPRYA